jgi:hypothetical protein
MIAEQSMTPSGMAGLAIDSTFEALDNEAMNCFKRNIIFPQLM